MPTAYIPHAKPERILGQLGLDGPGIAASIFKAIDPATGLRPPADMGTEGTVTEPRWWTAGPRSSRPTPPA